MHTTDLAFNQSLGLRLLPPDAGALLELPENAALLNHVGTVIAGAQFALGESASGELLLRELGGFVKGTFAVLRRAEVKYRKAAHGTLRATARFESGDANTVQVELTARGRVLLSIAVEVTDAAGVIVMSGVYEWFLQRGAGSLGPGAAQENKVP